jgi:hypothetical protein
MRITTAVCFFVLSGLACLSPTPAAAHEGTAIATPLYRLHRLDPVSMNFYTSQQWEKEAYIAKGWTSDGPVCYVSGSPMSGGVFLWRLWHPMTGDYYYTADPLSRDDYQHHRGDQPQKAAGYVLPPGTARPGTVPLYMGFDAYNSIHFYDLDKNNVNYGNYKYVMEVCRVWPDAAVVSEIRVTSPKPGAVLTVGTSHTITWTTTSNDGGVSLQYSADGGVSWKPITVKFAANTGSLGWTVPAPVTDHALIKASWVPSVTDVGSTWASGVMVAEFSIVNPANPPPPPPSPPPPNPPPPDPGNPPPNVLTLTATTSPGPQVHLSWTPGIPASVTGYTIERKPNVGAYSVIRILPKNVTKFQDAGVFPNVTYRYRVRAWLGFFKPWGYSNEVVVTTP